MFAPDLSQNVEKQGRWDYPSSLEVALDDVRFCRCQRRINRGVASLALWRNRNVCSVACLVDSLPVGGVLLALRCDGVSVMTIADSLGFSRNSIYKALEAGA